MAIVSVRSHWYETNIILFFLKPDNYAITIVKNVRIDFPLPMRDSSLTNIIYIVV